MRLNRDAKCFFPVESKDCTKSASYEVGQHGSYLFASEFSVVNTRGVQSDLKGLSLSKFFRKTFPSYSSSTLYVSIPEYYFGIILIDFCLIILLYKELKFLLFQRSVVKIGTSDQYSNTFKANCSTRFVYMYIFPYIVSVSVKQLYQSKAYTVCLLINKQLNLN